MSPESPKPQPHRRRRLVLGVLALWGCYLYFGTPAQFMLDREVDRLCKKNGGMQIYEQVRLTAERFDANGVLKAEDPIARGTDSDYKAQHFTNYLKNGSPKLVEHGYRIVRAVDQKIIGKDVNYIRAGGGLLDGAIQGNSYDCADSLKLAPRKTNLIREIFKPE